MKCSLNHNNFSIENKSELVYFCDYFMFLRIYVYIKVLNRQLSHILYTFSQPATVYDM